MKKIMIRVILLGCVSNAAVQAQTLDQQYVYYLAASCTNLNFARDASFQLLPGQAGPRLTAYCSGPPIVGGGGLTNSSSGSGAGAALEPGATEDSTLRRRRATARAADDTQATANTDDFGIVSNGNLSGFVSLRYQREKQASTAFEDGRRSQLFGATLGADLRLHGAALVGVLVKLDNATGDFNSGGDFRSSTRGFVVYGSWYPVDNLFVDLNAGADFLTHQNKRIASFSRTVISAGVSNTVIAIPAAALTSAPDGHAWEAELSSGYDLSLGSVTIGPRAALKTRRATLDAFTEAGSTPMALTIDAQTDTSLRSSIGMQSSKTFNTSHAVYVTQLNVDWLHEYQDDQRVITAQFAEDLRPDPIKFHYLNNAPDRDTFTARISLVAVFTQGFNSFLSFDRLFGHAYLNRYGATLGVRKEF